MNLFYPMAFYILYIGSIIILCFKTRKRAVSKKEMSFGFFKTYSGNASERVIVVGRHLDNQFQVPPLFMITCLSLQLTGNVTILTVSLAWGFVASRFLHSFIHLGSNKVPYRFMAFVLGWLVITAMWVILLIGL